MLEAAGLRTIADTIAKRRSNIDKTIEGRQVLKECREAEKRRGSPPRRMMWWDQELDFIEEGGGGGGLGFAMNTGGGGGMGARVGTAAGMMDRHSRLRRQQAEELGLTAEAAPPQPLRPPPQDAVPWHHRSGPIGGGLNIISAEEHAAMRAAMPRVFMPGEALPSL